jgi:hypothetical protein
VLSANVGIDVAPNESGFGVVGRAVDSVGIETHEFVQLCRGSTLRSRRRDPRRAEDRSFSSTAVETRCRPQHDVAADDPFYDWTVLRATTDYARDRLRKCCPARIRVVDYSGVTSLMSRVFLSHSSCDNR